MTSQTELFTSLFALPGQIPWAPMVEGNICWGVFLKGSGVEGILSEVFVLSYEIITKDLGILEL